MEISALVAFESSGVRPMRLASSAAADQPDAGATPDDADAAASAMEDLFAKQAEENLRRSAAGGPSDGDQADAQNERRGSHVAQAFDVFVPRPRDFVFGEHRAFGAEASVDVQPRNARRGKEKRKRR